MSVVSKRTIQRRIKKGMTRQQAESTPNTRRIQLTKDDFDALSKIGISYRCAAFILGVSAPCVSQKVKGYGIDWIGKDQKNPNAIRNKCILLGVSKSNVYRIKRTYNLTSDQALEIAYTRKLKKIMGFYHD
jgi:hypothetical protein